MGLKGVGFKLSDGPGWWGVLRAATAPASTKSWILLLWFTAHWSNTWSRV